MKGERRKTFHASFMSKEIQKVEKNTKIQNHQFGLRDYFYFREKLTENFEY